MFTTLMRADELRSHLQHADWLIFDCRFDLAQPTAGRMAYAEGHIHGAHYLHLDNDLSAPKTGHNGRHPLPDRAAFAEHMRALGLSRQTQVVVYDTQGGMFAARLWWMLRWIGHEKVAVLDGGLAAWIAAGGGLQLAIPAPRVPGDFVLVDSLESVRDAAGVLQALGSAGQVIVDARAADRFRGENETLDPVAGHIPGARNRFFRDNLAADGCFKPVEQLRNEWTGVLAGAAPAQVVHQCGSGVTACHNLLAMAHAGLTGSMLYPGSWSEWCADPARPVAIGA